MIDGLKPEASLIYAAIVRKIAAGELRPGERLVEVDLARSCGTSRTPIREVLFKLEKDGLIERNHNRGARVTAFTPDDIEQIYEIRTALECLAVRKAVKNIELNVLFDLERRLEEWRSKTGPGRYKSLHRVDLELHDLIAKYSGNQRLISHLEKLSLLIDSIRLLTLGAEQHFMANIEEHLAIIHALIRRDGVTAKKLMAEHIEGAKVRALEFFSRKAPARKKE